MLALEEAARMLGSPARRPDGLLRYTRTSQIARRQELVSIAQEVADLRRAARQEADRRLAEHLGGTWMQLLPPLCTAQRDAAVAACKLGLVVDDRGLGDQLDTFGPPPREAAAIAS
jgi:hypothetical protein